MTESILDIRDRLRPRVQLPASEPVTPENPEQARAATAEHLATPAFAVESADTGRIVITVPANRETAQISAEDFLLRLSGRLVEGEKANQNGAFWSQGDLEFGLPSVAMGPLNWLHQERKIVGVLSQAQLVRPVETASTSSSVQNKIGNPYISAEALLWKWLYPVEAREVERASDARQLWYSMECVARKVECVGENGCGTVVPYRERSSENACSHMRERSAHRRLVDPIFQGAAIIVPPVKPGWADADLSVTRQAAALVEDNQLELGLSTSDAERMVAQVLAYANTSG